MGMYDDITLAAEFVLPDRAPTRSYQTKCLECVLDHYHIDSSGRLLVLKFDLINDGPSGPHPIFKSLKNHQPMKSVNHYYEPVDYSGTITFYSSGRNGINHVWREYTAVVYEGSVKNVKRIERA